MPSTPLAMTTGSLPASATLVERLAAGFLLAYRAGNTRDAYRRDLAQWVRWCHDHAVQPLEAARGHVDAYARQLEVSGRLPATVARKLSAVAGFYSYAVGEGYVARSPVERVRRPRVGDDSPTLGLDRAEAAALLVAAEKDGPHRYALACLLLLNGLRVSEVCALDVEDLGWQRGHRTVRVTRKGARRATVPLAPRTGDAVADAVSGRTSGAVLLNAQERRMTRTNAFRAIGVLARHAGIDKAISPHSLRHTCATLSLEAGVPLHRVQDALGHADPRTTRRYDRAREQLDNHATYALAAFLGSP